MVWGGGFGGTAPTRGARGRRAARAHAWARCFWAVAAAPRGRTHTLLCQGVCGNRQHIWSGTNSLPFPSHQASSTAAVVAALTLTLAAAQRDATAWPPAEGPLANLPEPPPLPLPGTPRPAGGRKYNVQPDGTCGAPGQFLTILVTGTSGSLSNAACSLGFEGFPDPQPDDACDGSIFGTECTRLAAGLVITVGGFGRVTDSPDVGAILNLVGLGKLETAEGGLFFDVSDGARAKAFDAFPRLTRVGGGGLQLLGGRQVARAPALSHVSSVDGSLFLVSTELRDAASLSSLKTVADATVAVNNFNMTSLVGATNLTSIGGGLVLAANHRLRDLDGLRVLTSVGGGASIANNTRLVSLAGLAGLTTLGGKLHIANNPTLVSLEGLASLTRVGGVGGGGAAAGAAAKASTVRPATAPAALNTSALDGVAHADIAIVGNRVLWNVSALAGLGGCGGAPPPPTPRPSITLEVYPTTGVAADEESVAAANAAAARAARAVLHGAGGGSAETTADADAASDAGGFTPDAELPPMANDVDAPRQAELRAAALRAAAAAGKPSPPRGFLVAAADPASGVTHVMQAAVDGDAGGFTQAASASVAAGDAVSGAAEDAAAAAAASAASAAPALAAAWSAGVQAESAAAEAVAAPAPASTDGVAEAETTLEALMQGEGSDDDDDDGGASSPYGPQALADAAEHDHPDTVGVYSSATANDDAAVLLEAASTVAGRGASPEEVAAAAANLAAALDASPAPSRRRLASTSIDDDDPSAPEVPVRRGTSSAPAGDSRRAAADPLSRWLAATPLGAVLPAPPEPPLARLASGAAAGGPDVRPPWARSAAPAADPADPPPDPRLSAALALKPDTRCLFTSWTDVCEYVKEGGQAIGAGHRWRADGTCVPHVPPALAAGAPAGPPLRISG